MEKFVRKLSTLITFVLLYIVASYSYLSAKGFELKNGTFTLISTAQAASTPETNDFAQTLDPSLAFNFNEPVILGKSSAPITIYEFSSLGCSHCADFHLNILPRLTPKWINTGKLKIVFVNFPLEKKAMQGAMLYACLPTSARHGFLTKAFVNQRDWMLSSNSDKILTGYAGEYGLTPDRAQACLKNKQTAMDLLAQRQEAIESLAIQGTPAFVIEKDGVRAIHYGLPTEEALSAYLSKLLES